jgi:hypothetical protein
LISAKKRNKKPHASVPLRETSTEMEKISSVFL